MPRYLGEYSNVAKCAAACRAEVGCEFFVFNVMDSTGSFSTLASIFCFV